MGRVVGSASGTRGTKIEVQSAFVLVGAPGIGKSKIADTLARDYFPEKLAVQNETYPEGAALGMMADYRMELFIAARRATRIVTHEKPLLYTHSLIDSLAYSLSRVDMGEAMSDAEMERWALTMGACGGMLRDTFKADEVLFLGAAFDPSTHFDQFKVQEVQEFILEGYGYPYTVIDVEKEDTIDDIATIIGSYIG